MPSVLSRMRRMKTLLDIRLGPGAAVMSPNVQRIHMKFAVKMDDGHMGPRKFWHHYLPRLKYHNPAIPMSVERITNQTGPASLTVYFASANPSETSTAEHTKTINMKHKTSEDILSEFLKMTDAAEVKPSEQDKAELSKLEDERIRAETDRAFTAKRVAEQRRQAILLQRAKSL